MITSEISTREIEDLLESLVSFEDMERLFPKSDYSDTDARSVLANGCLKVMNEYTNGHTVAFILKDLELTVEKYGRVFLTDKGKKFTYWCFARCLDEKFN